MGVGKTWSYYIGCLVWVKLVIIGSTSTNFSSKVRLYVNDILIVWYEAFCNNIIIYSIHTVYLNGVLFELVCSVIYYFIYFTLLLLFLFL